MTLETRSFALDGVRADGWFERLGEGSADFPQLCEVVGERFVAFSVISGVRITALTVDRRAPDATLVDFLVGEDLAEQRLPLGEFRRRLCAALLADDDPLEPLVEAPTADQLQATIGFRFLLLAPVFGIRLQQLRVDADGQQWIAFQHGGADDELTIADLREMIRERVRTEQMRHRPSSPFAIDLASIPDAQSATERGDHERVIELLGAWPGPLSLLLRTAEGQQLAPEVKATLARSLGLLGTAYVRTQRHEWAEEVMRLAIQWGQDSSAAGELFGRLGEGYVALDRHGEAIGLLRRALGLAGDRATILPMLAGCYLARGRHVAAAICAIEAAEAGADAEAMQGLHDRAVAALGEHWSRFRDRVPHAVPAWQVGGRDDARDAAPSKPGSEATAGDHEDP